MRRAMRSADAGASRAGSSASQRRRDQRSDVERPVGGEHAGPAGDRFVEADVLTPQEAERRRERRRADVLAFLQQAERLEPVLVELQAQRQRLRDGLVERRDHEPPDSRFPHFLVTYRADRAAVPRGSRPAASPIRHVDAAPRPTHLRGGDPGRRPRHAAARRRQGRPRRRRPHHPRSPARRARRPRRRRLPDRRRRPAPTIGTGLPRVPDLAAGARPARRHPGRAASRRRRRVHAHCGMRPAVSVASVPGASAGSRPRRRRRRRRRAAKRRSPSPVVRDIQSSRAGGGRSARRVGRAGGAGARSTRCASTSSGRRWWPHSIPRASCSGT